VTKLIRTSLSLATRNPSVLDLHMPHMDGFNVQAHLAGKYAALPVIIVPSHDLANAHERAMQSGASAFLRKPVFDRTLLDAVSTATSSAQPEGSPSGK
jgi:FixJ family two-component response regulator